jgi:putative addiction module component (TIGR02574 family)
MRMPMTLDQIVEEAGRLPTRQVVELVERLSQWLHLSSEVEESWKAETRRRIADIEAGKVQGIPGPEVSARIRKVVGR